MDRAPFSVSMCVYGGDNPEHFKTAVESILNQTVTPNEIVLVVDGPVQDDLNTVILDFENREAFNVIRLKENMGHGNARRIGLENCKYELVALMDADDISVPDRFERQLEIFSQYQSISVVGGNMAEFINTPTNVIGFRNVPQKDSEIKLYMQNRCPMNQVTVMFKKQDIYAVGGYIDWFCEEDYYLWLRLMLGNYSFMNINKVLVYVRVGKDMIHRRGGWKYFLSEVQLQKYMKSKGIIAIHKFIINVGKRYFVQILLPNKLRSWVFKNFAREKLG